MEGLFSLFRLNCKVDPNLFCYNVELLLANLNRKEQDFLNIILKNYIRLFKVFVNSDPTYAHEVIGSEVDLDNVGKVFRTLLNFVNERTQIVLNLENFGPLISQKQTAAKILFFETKELISKLNTEEKKVLNIILRDIVIPMFKDFSSY